MTNRTFLMLMAMTTLSISSCMATNAKESNFIHSQKPITQVESILVFESDTIYLGDFIKNQDQDVVYFYGKCKGEEDIHIDDISISDPNIVIAASPVTTPNTLCSIMCILPIRSLNVGNHIETITITTNSIIKPKRIIYIKYNIKDVSNENINIIVDDTTLLN